MSAPYISIPHTSRHDNDDDERTTKSIQAPGGRYLHPDNRIALRYSPIRIRPTPDDDEDDKAILTEMVRNLNGDTRSVATAEWAILSRVDRTTLPLRYWNTFRTVIREREYETAGLMTLTYLTGRAQPETNQSEDLVGHEEGLELIDEFYGDGIFTEGTEEEQKMINEAQCAELEKNLR